MQSYTYKVKLHLCTFICPAFPIIYYIFIILIIHYIFIIFISIKLRIYKLIHLYLYYPKYIIVLAKCSIPGLEKNIPGSQTLLGLYFYL